MLVRGARSMRTNGGLANRPANRPPSPGSAAAMLLRGGRGRSRSHAFAGRSPAAVFVRGSDPILTDMRRHSPVNMVAFPTTLRVAPRTPTGLEACTPLPPTAWPLEVGERELDGCPRLARSPAPPPPGERCPLAAPSAPPGAVAPPPPPLWPRPAHPASRGGQQLAGRPAQRALREPPARRPPGPVGGRGAASIGPRR